MAVKPHEVLKFSGFQKLVYWQ